MMQSDVESYLASFIIMNKDYVAVTLDSVKQEELDLVVAMLADIGFEGFEETDDTLKAYISKAEFAEERVKEIADQFSLFFKQEDVQPQNWNAVWESNFEPVVIDDFIAVRAHFHEVIKNVQHEIVITPKMSFGTGHHATTTMMIQQMRNLDFVNKTVFDFGTGTGILSILAEKLGSADVLAIDNDEWSIENSKENIERNNCNHIKIEHRNNADVKRSFDLILANINRNVIIDNLSFLSSQLNENGSLLISGLLAEDEEMILTEAKHYQLKHVNTLYRLQWISLLCGR